MKPFRYRIFAKLVIGTFLSFFLLLRIEGTTGAACIANTVERRQRQHHCTEPESQLTNTNQLFKVSTDIPGVEPKDLDVSVDNELRTIEMVANRRDEQGGNVVGCYQQSWTLDDSVDLKSLVMQHDNGVLTVWAPKDPQRHRPPSFKKQAFVRGSSMTSSTTTNVSSAPNSSKPKPFVVKKKMERDEVPILPEEDEDPMSVEPIAYDEQELLESVSVLTDEDGGEHWGHRI